MKRRRIANAWMCATVSALVSSQAAHAQSSVGPDLSLVGAAVDEARDRLVIVGGTTRDSLHAQTWEWDGNAWTGHSAGGPSPRDEALLVYDGTRRRVVLFGGNLAGQQPATDTWSWDGRQWQLLSSEGPSARAATMAYDTRRDRIVLFGGGTPTGRLHNDTWEFDGRLWHRVVADSLPNSPRARALNGLAFDARRGVVVLHAGFGGFDPARRQPIMLDDTWEWDGTTWSRIDVSGPGARDHVAMTYSAAAGAVVMHGGGKAQQGLQSDTWTYDGRSWTLIGQDGPARGRHRLMDMPSTAGILSFGGWGPNSMRSTDLWVARSGAWTRAWPPAPTWDDMHPAFSRDGTTIAFTSNRQGRFQLHTLRLHDGAVRRVGSGSGASYWPSWSPDGRQLVFDSNRDGNQEVYVLDLSSGMEVRLTTDTVAYDGVSAWSSSGLIAFDSNRRPDSAADIWVMRGDGTSQRALWSDSASDGHPSWSPDNRYLAFKTGPLRGAAPRPAEIAIVELATGARRTITANGGVNGAPTWSPDGRRIAFVSRRGGETDLYEIGIDGNGERRLTSSAGDEGRPGYATDGGSMVFARRFAGRWSLYLLDLTTGLERAVPQSR